jgi:S-DNA-T family DNA segregation ATPase FtsK/SpoIIIE
MGADKLLGNGDMLFLWPGTSTLLRGQGTYLSDEEINSIVDCCSRGEQNFVQELVNMKVKEPEEEEGKAKPGALKKRDELYESAVDMVVREGRGSVSLLQRALGIGYGRAARLIDFMAEDGIVGQYNGSQARDILITLADWERMQGLTEGDETAAAPAPAKVRDVANTSPKRRNIVRPEPWAEEPDADGLDGVGDDSEIENDWSDASEPDEVDEASENDADYRAESA